MADPLVSIICITYNHEPYIRQCLDGFMMQKTNFPFEVLIHDDASTDMTADIIREYEARYPDVIKPIYQTENQYSKGVKIGLTYLYPNAKGKYIAECEGDDYWTDPLKLQKQVDYLENNPDCVLTCHQYKILQGIKEESSTNWIQGISFYNITTFVSSEWFIQPLTVVFRAKSLDISEYSRYGYAKDVTLFYYLLKQGNGYFFQDEMGVYRLHCGGTYFNSSWASKLISDLRTLNAISVVEGDRISSVMLKRYLDKTVKNIGRRTLLKERRLFYSIWCQLRPYYSRAQLVKTMLKLG